MHYLCIRFKKSPQRPQADAESKRYTQLVLQGGLKLPTGYVRNMIPEGDANRAEPLMQYLCDSNEVVNLNSESQTNT